MQKEGFWTIGFRRIINKRNRNDLWVLCGNGVLTRISCLMFVDYISWRPRFESYSIANDRLTILKVKAKDKKDSKLTKQLNNSKVIYVKNNTERESPILYGTGENRI